jgi:hypothetical protein
MRYKGYYEKFRNKVEFLENFIFSKKEPPPFCIDGGFNQTPQTKPSIPPKNPGGLSVRGPLVPFWRGTWGGELPILKPICKTFVGFFLFKKFSLMQGINFLHHEASTITPCNILLFRLFRVEANNQGRGEA